MWKSINLRVFCHQARYETACMKVVLFTIDCPFLFLSRYFSSKREEEEIKANVFSVLNKSSSFPHVTALHTAALYVHWPYCKRRCTYCNFNKYIEKSVDHVRMRENLLKEAETLLQLSGVSAITSVFFGGGTPSLAEPSTIQALLSSLSNEVSIPNGSEVTMEFNPTLTEKGKLSEFRDAGINRVSLGVQTLNADGLRILGRDHSATDSLRCLELALSLYPGQVSVDLIFGWPGHSLDSWLMELKQILPLCDHHISLYQLTLERGTQLFKQVNSKQLILPRVNVTEDMYIEAVKVLSDYGYERYEVSNFAKENSYSKHNMSYWTAQQYIGIGPGAHSRFVPLNKELREARIQTQDPQDWMWEVEHYGQATCKREPLSPLQQQEELLMTALGTKWGLSHQMWTSLNPGVNLIQHVTSAPRIQSHIDTGLLILDTTHLRASSQGLNILDTILTDLIVILEESCGKE